MAYNFSQSVVIVTGASSGIGAQVAVDFARCGAKLALTGRNEENLQKIVTRCVEAGQTPQNIHTSIGDVLKEEYIDQLLDGVLDKFGRIDVLVNNAGSYVRGKIDVATVDDMDCMYNLHVRSVFLLMKKTIPKLIETKGNIVNISAVGGSRPINHSLAFSVSKAALNQLTACVANDVADKGVRVNAVAPAVIETEIMEKTVSDRGSKESYQEFLARKGADHPMNRVGDVNEVSQAVLFLASPAASFTTGAIFPVDGGRINNVGCGHETI